METEVLKRVSKTGKIEGEGGKEDAGGCEAICREESTINKKRVKSRKRRDELEREKCRVQ